MECSHSSDSLRRGVERERLFPVVALTASDRRRQIVQKPRAGDDGACTRSAATVWLREGLVQVRVNDVETQVAELDPSDNGVEVGAVAVHNAAGVADDPGYIQDIRVEEAKSAGQGYHQPCEFVAYGVSQGIEIGVSVGVRGQRDDVETSHRCGCRVGPVRRVGDQNVLALIVAAIEMVGPCHQKARELTVSARHRRE